ncbi:34216_t:CDS:1, partial [Gigaspora margarita]
SNKPTKNNYQKILLTKPSPKKPCQNPTPKKTKKRTNAKHRTNAL